MMRFEPPTIKERGKVARATAEAMNAALQAMEQNQGDRGRLKCAACGGVINWSGSAGRSSGSCATPRCARWAT